MTYPFRFLRPAVFTVFAVLSNPLFADDNLGSTAEAPGGATTINFEDANLGPVADELAFVIDGEFAVVARGDNKVLEAAATPLVESGALVGENIEGGVVVSAKIHATKRGRSYPRFGIGTHGMSGYRLRVVPARKIIELVYREKPVADAPFPWTSDAWLHLELEVKKTGEETWMIAGKAWKDGDPEPAEATLARVDKGLRGKGKSSVWGTPYSGTPIAFDDIEIGVLPGS